MGGYQNLYAPVQHLNKADAKPGGLCYIYFARWEDVAQWPAIDPITGINSTAVVLNTGATWYRMQVAPKEKILTETSKTSNAGSYVESKITAYLGDNSAQQTLSIKMMMFSQYALIVEEKNGILWLIGDGDSGAELDFNYNSGDIEASRKRTIDFTWASENGATLYNTTGVTQDAGTITPPFMELGDFNDDFGNDFNN